MHDCDRLGRADGLPITIQLPDVLGMIAVNASVD